METGYLKEYIEFSKTLNYTKAADDLFVSQPTLRSHIRSLEEELETTLTIKRNNRIELSPTGKLFLKRAREIVRIANTTLEECRALSQASTSLLVGTLSYPWFEEKLLEARETFKTKNPEKYIELLFSSKMHANLEAVANEEVDLSLYPRIRDHEQRLTPNKPTFPPEITGYYIGEEECFFWMTNNHPLFQKSIIEASDLRESTLLMGNTQNMIHGGIALQTYFAAEGIRINVDNQPYASYTDYFFSSVSNVFGIMFKDSHPTYEHRKDFRVFTVKEFHVPCDLFLIYNKSRFSQSGLSYLDEVKTFCHHQ
ncbi:MAG: LysR family transcriptional regulator [Raoultibacter sp.]